MLNISINFAQISFMGFLSLVAILLFFVLDILLILFIVNYIFYKSKIKSILKELITIEKDIDLISNSKYPLARDIEKKYNNIPQRLHNIKLYLDPKNKYYLINIFAYSLTFDSYGHDFYKYYKESLVRFDDCINSYRDFLNNNYNYLIYLKHLIIAIKTIIKGEKQ